MATIYHPDIQYSKKPGDLAPGQGGAGTSNPGGYVASPTTGLYGGGGGVNTSTTIPSTSYGRTSSSSSRGGGLRASTQGLVSTPTLKSTIPSNVGTFSSMNLYNQTVGGSTKRKYDAAGNRIEDDENKTQQDIFGDIMYGDKTPTRTPYTGEGFATTQGKFKKGVKISLPKELNVYGEAAKIAEQAAKGTISKRNDYIVSNLFAEGAKTKDDIRNFLNAQQGFMGANTVDQQNTVEAIAARMGITKESLTPQDMIAQQQDELLKSYQDEQGQLILDADQQKAWKEFDAIGGTDPSKYPTPEEINTIATKYGLDPKKAQEAADAWKIAKDKSIEQQRWKEKDIGTEKDRNIEDARTQIQRNREDVNRQVDDVVTQMERDVAGAEKVGALKGYSLSSGYMDGINNVKTDANKVLDRLHTALSRAEADTAKYITRISDDYTTNMSRLKTSMTDQLMNNKMAGTAEVQALLTKYAPTDVLLTKELKRVNDEFGTKSQALYKSFLENFKGITDAAMYESEKLQEYTYKQRQLADLTIQNLMANNGMALRSMSDAAIEDLYKAGYIGKEDVTMLKNAKIGANQMYNDYLKEVGINETTNTLNKTVDRNKVIATYKDIINSGVSYEDGVSQIPDGTPGGQCGYFANNIAQAMGLPKLFGDSLDSKKAQINSNVPVIGGFAVMNSKSAPENGHVGFVIGINGDGTIKVKSSNYGGDEAVRTDNVSPSSIIGYVNIAGKLKPMTGEEDKGPEIVDTGNEMKESYLLRLKRGNLTNSEYDDIQQIARKQGWLSEYNEALKQGFKTNLTPAQEKAYDKLGADIEKNPVVQKADEVRGQADTVIALLSQNVEEDGFNDIGLINTFQRIVDPGATVRSEDVNLLQSAANFKQSIQIKLDRVFSKGEKLTPELRKSMLSNAIEIYNARAKYANYVIDKRYKPRAIAAGLDWDNMGYNYELLDMNLDTRVSSSDNVNTTAGGEGSNYSGFSQYSRLNN